MSDRFRLRSEWHVHATIDAVWHLLAHPCAWPRWWPHVESVETLAAGAPDGTGAVHRLRWSSALGYGLVLRVATTLVERPRRIIGEASGDLTGIGHWELAPVALGTRVRYGWDVAATRPWMRIATPWLRPLFAWNHHRVMRAGAGGMARELGVELIDYRALAPTPVSRR